MSEKLDILIGEIPKIKTCGYSCLSEGRMWCNLRNKTTIGYCEGCSLYQLKINR